MDEKQLNQRKSLIVTLQTLLSRIEGCNDPDCSVCRSNKLHIDNLAEQLNLDETEKDYITPKHLKQIEYR